MPTICGFGIPLRRTLEVLLSAITIFEVYGKLKLSKAIPALGSFTNSLGKVQISHNQSVSTSLLGPQ